MEAQEGWLDYFSHDQPDVLSVGELEKYVTLRFPKRRQEWLLGRMTAKYLLQQSRADSKGLKPAEIEVRNNAEGAPNYILPYGFEKPGCLSISHRDTLAYCALVSKPVLRVGADLERVEPRSMAFVEAFFTAQEVMRVRACPPEFRDRLVTLIWSAKEALLKALGRGLRIDTRRVEILKEEQLTGETADWRDLSVSMSWAGGSWTAWWRPYGEYVLTLAAWDKNGSRHPYVLEEISTELG